MKLLETLLALLFADVRIDNAVLIVLVIVVKIDVVVVVTLSIGCQHDVVIHPHWAWRGSYNRRAGSRATGGNTCRAGSTAGLAISHSFNHPGASSACTTCSTGRSGCDIYTVSKNLDLLFTRRLWKKNLVRGVQL